MIYTHYYEREMSVRSFTMNMGHPWPLVTHVEHFCHSGGCNCALCRVIELPLFPSTVLWNVLRAEHWNAEAGEWLMCRLHDLGVMSFTVWGVGKWWGTKHYGWRWNYMIKGLIRMEQDLSLQLQGLNLRLLYQQHRHFTIQKVSCKGW